MPYHGPHKIRMRLRGDAAPREGVALDPFAPAFPGHREVSPGVFVAPRGSPGPGLPRGMPAPDRLGVGGVIRRIVDLIMRGAGSARGVRGLSGFSVQRESIQYGDAGIEQTLRHMVRIAESATRDPDVIALAHDLVRALPERNKPLEAHTVLSFVREHLRYTDDPFDAKGGKEMIKDPRLVVREIRQHGRYVGDCDDAVTTSIALLSVVGIPAFPIVIDTGTGEYSHVLVGMSIDGRVETYDPIVRGTPIGWFPRGATRVGSMR